MLFDGKATDALSERPNCDICSQQGYDVPAAVDAATSMGPWANMCLHHMQQYGYGLGEGRGQVLLCGDEMDATLKRHYHLH